LEQYYNEPDNTSVQQNSKLEGEGMFDSQIKSIISNLKSFFEVGGINDSIVALKIVEAAKKSMKTKRVIILN